MTDELIEIVARAAYEADWPLVKHASWIETESDMRERYRTIAIAALQSIQSSGTFMVVPVGPSEHRWQANISDDMYDEL